MQLPNDRIVINSALLVAAFLAVMLLSSQSAASMVSYVLCIAMLVRFKDWEDVLHCPMVWPVLAVLIYLPATSFWSETFGFRDLLSQGGRALLTFCFVVAFAECQLRGVLQEWLFTALGWVGACVALLCIVLFVVEPPADGRLNGLGQLDTQVVAGVVFAFAAIAVLHTFLVAASKSRWLTLALLVPLVSAVWLTDSRSALLSMLLGGTVLVTAHRQESLGKFLWLVGGIVLALGGALSIAWFVPDIREWVFPRGDSFRLVIWEQTLRSLQESPIFGLGILTSDDVVVGATRFLHPHSLYLSVAYQGGVVGLALFGWMLIRVLRELLLAYDQADVKFALGVLGLALPAYALDGHELLDKIGDTWFLIWLPVAIALGTRWHRTYKYVKPIDELDR